MEIQIKQEAVDAKEFHVQFTSDVLYIKQEDFSRDNIHNGAIDDKSRLATVINDKIKIEEFNVDKAVMEREHAVTLKTEAEAQVQRKSLSAKSKYIKRIGFQAKLTLKPDVKKKVSSHFNLKLFACDQCSFRCRYQSSLLTHTFVHTGEKPFACDQCSYICNTSSNLKTHKRKHTGEKYIACDQCSYTCNMKSDLIRHRLIHTGEKPFGCDQCSYTCNRKGSLNTHKLTHSGEKPFACDQCVYTCNRNFSLTKHKRTHTDEKPLSFD